MDNTADWDIFELKGVTRFDIRFGARFDCITHFEPLGRKDVALVTVGILQQRNIRRAVGIVFECRDDCRNTVAVSFEINYTQPPFMTTSAMAHGHMAAVITAS